LECIKHSRCIETCPNCIEERPATMILTLKPIVWYSSRKIQKSIS
jgi:hypothetical protein